MSYANMIFPDRPKASWWTRFWCTHPGWDKANDSLGPHWCCTRCGKVIQADEEPPSFPAPVGIDTPLVIVTAYCPHCGKTVAYVGPDMVYKFKKCGCGWVVQVAPAEPLLRPPVRVQMDVNNMRGGRPNKPAGFT